MTPEFQNDPIIYYLNCIASQFLSSPCVLFFLRNFDGRRTRVSMMKHVQFNISRNCTKKSVVFPGDLAAFSCKGKTDRHTLTPFPWGDHPWNVTHPKFLYRPPKPRSQGLSSSLPPSSRAPGEGKRRGPGNEVAATSASYKNHRIGLNHLKERLHNTILKPHLHYRKVLARLG